MDSSLSQVLRWSMAGWSMIIEVAAFFGAYKLLLGTRTAPFSLLAGRVVSLAEPSAILAVLAAVGVPLGYLLYEGYYFVFWTVPLQRRPIEQEMLRRLRGYANGDIEDKELWEAHAEWSDEICLPKGRLSIVAARVTAHIYRITREFTAPVRRLLLRLDARLGRPRSEDGAADSPNGAGWTPSKDAAWIQTITEVRGRSPRDLIDWRRDWSLIRAVWYCAMTRGDDMNVGYEHAAVRFEYLTSMYDGLGALLIANVGAWTAAQLLKVWWLLSVPEWSSAFRLELNFLEGPLPAWESLLILTAIETAVCYVLHRMIWVNRVHLRSSVVTLLNAFIRHPDCAYESDHAEHNDDD